MARHDEQVSAALMAAQSQEGYRQAFLAQTGLKPHEVAMLYGEELVEEGGHIMKRFKVRFVTLTVADEIGQLQEEIELLTRKNCALQMVLAPLSVKAGISDGAVVELLRSAEAQIIGTAGNEIEDAELADVGGPCVPCHNVPMECPGAAACDNCHAEQKLGEDVEDGAIAATKMVEHLRAMGAASCNIPVVVEGEHYMVSVAAEPFQPAG
jgi:hypothetical protein